MTRRLLAWTALLFVGLPIFGQAAPPSAEIAAKTVYVARGLSDPDLVVLTASVAAADPSAVILLDTPDARSGNDAFLAAYQPTAVIPVGTFPEASAERERRWGRAVRPVEAVKGGRPAGLWERWFARADRVVVCPAEPFGPFLQAACLAGTLKAPLVALPAKADANVLRKQFHAWRTRYAYAVGDAAEVCRDCPDVRVVALANPDAVAREHRQKLTARGPIPALVLANPADRMRDLGGTSVLAPWFALRRRAALALTGPGGDDATDRLHKALAQPGMERCDTLLIAAGLKAVPMEKRPNPLAGKDEFIEMEPGTPRDNRPFSLSTGRLFHAERGIALLMLERGQLLARTGPRKALVASNPGGGLPLLETFSRQTARELANGGYLTIARYEDDVKADELRRLLPQQDIFLWEGHYKTLVEEFGMPKWKEPLRPSLIVLQSCLALNEPEVRPLFARGAYAVVGSSTRTYSASGGAFTLSFFDAMIYDGASLGGSLRQAKNFLQCYAILKKHRLGEAAKLHGANVRSSWAFTLWGDPTLTLPPPTAAAKGRVPVRAAVIGESLSLKLPAKRYGLLEREPYRVRLWPNGRMAGLLVKDSEEEKRLVPLAFAEVRLEPPAPGQVPHLFTPLPSRHWAFNWDERRQRGYLLVAPRVKDGDEIQFRVSWRDPSHSAKLGG